MGLWGLGAALLSLVRLKFPSPWDQVAALLLGIQTLSLAVQITAFLEINSRPVLVTIWLSLVVIGAVMLVNRARQFEIPQLPLRWQQLLRYWPAAMPLAIVAIAVATNTLVALAPSTKVDDLYYHMLVPSRIVSAGGLQFYREPWEAAIWPHMVFQISATPAHALGYPDSVNIVSWALSRDSTLVCMAYHPRQCEHCSLERFVHRKLIGRSLPHRLAYLLQCTRDGRLGFSGGNSSIL